jgi:hypothetical protein
VKRRDRRERPEAKRPHPVLTKERFYMALAVVVGLAAWIAVAAHTLQTHAVIRGARMLP